MLISKRESLNLKHCNDPKAFIEYSNDKNGIYEDINEYNANEKCKIFIAFDEMIAYMLSNKILRTLMTELFIRSRK